MAELMPLHEVRRYALETPKPEKHMIWVERRKAKTLEYLHIYCVSGGFGEREALEIDVEGTSETISLPFSTYKRSWRCWTDRPSDEQMSGAGWYYKTEYQRAYQKTEKRREYMREYMREYNKRHKKAVKQDELDRG